MDYAENEELVYDATINGKSVTVFLDSGASHTFMSPGAAKHYDVTIKDLAHTDLTLGNGSTVKVLGTAKARVVLNGHLCDEEILLLPLPDDYQIIVGRKWLKQRNPEVDWRSKILKISRKDGSMCISNRAIL